MKVTDSHVYFYSKTVFSNWYLCILIDPLTGLAFNNTEVAFMYYKADFFKDELVKNKLSKELSPKNAKQFGREIKNFDNNAWHCVKFGYMVYVNYLKFSQDENLKQQLLNTGNKVLVEASKTDLVWGVGISENDDKILDDENWPGENLLGKALMRVRNLVK